MILVERIIALPQIVFGYMVFRFAMEYGLRIGEVRAIMKDAVKDGRISIKRAFSDNDLRESTKTGDVRAYDLTPYAKEIIDALPAHFSPFVFVREDGKPYTNKNLNAIWRAACEKAGIRIKLYNAARHSLGCQLLDEGKDLSFVQEVLGHRQQEMTRRYARRTAKHVGNVLADRRRVVQLDDIRERKKLVTEISGNNNNNISYLMVEAAGVEPASGNLPLHFLRTYLLFWVSLLMAPGSRILQSLSCLDFRPSLPRRERSVILPV